MTGELSADGLNGGPVGWQPQSGIGLVSHGGAGNIGVGWSVAFGRGARSSAATRTRGGTRVAGPHGTKEYRCPDAAQTCGQQFVHPRGQDKLEALPVVEPLARRRPRR